MKVQILLVASLLVLLSSVSAYADETRLQESVSSLSKRGKYLDAITAFKQIEDGKRTLADKIACAQSAWALGMADIAREQWNEILANPDFKGVERYRAVLSLSMLELQEYHYDKARALAEKTLPELQSSDLKAQYLIVIGEALTEQGAHSKAEQYYKEAAEIGNDVIRSEAKYYLGENQLALGRLDAARRSFTEVETASDYAPRALQRLIRIDLEQGKYDGVLTWIKEGREEFPMQFEDSWVRYAVVTALSESTQLTRADEELKSFKARYGDQDPWYVLAQASYEGKQLSSSLASLDPTRIQPVVGDPKAADDDDDRTSVKSVLSSSSGNNTKVVASAKNVKQVSRKAKGK